MKRILGMLAAIGLLVPSGAHSQSNNTERRGIAAEAVKALMAQRYVGYSISILPSKDATLDDSVAKAMKVAIKATDRESGARVKVLDIHVVGDSASVYVQVLLKDDNTRHLETNEVNLRRRDGVWRVERSRVIEIS